MSRTRCARATSERVGGGGGSRVLLLLLRVAATRVNNNLPHLPACRRETYLRRIREGAKLLDCALPPEADMFEFDGCESSRGGCYQEGHFVMDSVRVRWGVGGGAHTLAAATTNLLVLGGAEQSEHGPGAQAIESVPRARDPCAQPEEEEQPEEQPEQPEQQQVEPEQQQEPEEEEEDDDDEVPAILQDTPDDAAPPLDPRPARRQRRPPPGQQ